MIPKTSGEDEIDCRAPSGLTMTSDEVSDTPGGPGFPGVAADSAGIADAVGVAVGTAAGVGVGAGVGIGVGVGVAEGKGEGDGLGDGVGVGAGTTVETWGF